MAVQTQGVVGSNGSSLGRSVWLMCDNRKQGIMIRLVESKSRCLSSNPTQCVLLRTDTDLWLVKSEKGPHHAMCCEL